MVRSQSTTHRTDVDVDVDVDASRSTQLARIDRHNEKPNYSILRSAPRLDMSKLDMTFGPRDHPASRVALRVVTGNGYTTFRRLVLYFPASFFSNGGEGLSDVGRDNIIARYRVGLLHTLAHLCSNPYVCMEGGDKPDKDVDEKQRDTDRQRYMRTTPPGGGPEIFLSRVLIHFEVVRAAKDEDRIAGYRWWIDCRDDAMDFDRGVENLVVMNRKRREKEMERSGPRRPVEEWEPFMDVYDRGAWVDNFVRRATPVGEVDTASAHVEPLTAPDHPASLYAALSPRTWFECKSLRGVFHPDQASYDRYFPTQQDPGNNRFYFPRPQDVWRVDPRQFHPKLLHRFRFPHLEGPTALRLSRLTPEEREAHAGLQQFELLRSHQADAPPEDFNGFDQLAEVNERKLDEMLAKPDGKRLVRAWRESAKAIDDYVSTTLDEGSNPKRVVALFAWYKERDERAKAAGRDWSAVAPHTQIDPCLSPFANYVARKLYQYETVYHIKTMHATLFTTFVALLGCFHVSQVMKTNVLLSGAAMTGKSLVGRLLRKRFFPPGIVTNVSRVTDKGLQTANEGEIRHSVQFYDEMQRKHVGLDEQGNTDGTGDPIMKTLLTEQELSIQEFVVVEAHFSRVAEFALVDDEIQRCDFHLADPAWLLANGLTLTRKPFKQPSGDKRFSSLGAAWAWARNASREAQPIEEV